MELVKILNIDIHNITTQELLEKLNRSGGVVVTPNVDHMVKLQRDYGLLKAYYLSNYRICDSKILQYASKFLGQPIKEKISGSDLFPAFYEYNKSNENIRIFLLGAQEGVAQKARENINQKVRRNMVVDTYSPSFGFEKNEAECQEIIDRINNSEATVLAIGVGAPKQEKWIAKYKNQLRNIRIFLAIGATIDFEAGYKPRSPEWMSNVGLEWFYRLASEPNRLWKRYLVESLPFFWLIYQQKLQRYQVPAEFLLNSLPIGELLQQAGLISINQVQQVLQAQESLMHERRFGEIITDWGWLEQGTIDFFADELPSLINQQKKLRLGEYLNNARLLKKEQITQILTEQSQSQQKFGEIAIQKGWVKPETVNWLVNLNDRIPSKSNYAALAQKKVNPPMREVVKAVGILD